MFGAGAYYTICVSNCFAHESGFRVNRKWLNNVQIWGSDYYVRSIHNPQVRQVGVSLF